jgi:phage terminase small subunit
MPARSRGRNPRSSSAKGKKRVAAQPRTRAESSPGTSAPARKIPNPFGIILDEGLTGAQLVFVETLCADPTKPAVHAARVAYPEQAENTLYKTAHENVRNPKIIRAIRRRLEPLLHTTRTSRENVTRLIGEGMHYDPADIYAEDGSIKPVKDWPVECRRQLVSIEVDEIRLTATGPVVGHTKRVKLADRHGYVTLGARMNKMLTDKVEHSGSLLEDLVAASRKAS